MREIKNGENVLLNETSFDVRNVTVIVINLTGCIPMMAMSAHDSAVKKMPTYAETKAAWEPIPTGYGRLVVFWPIIPLKVIAPMGGNCINIKVDDIKGPGVCDQTFVFLDLPVGKHTIRYWGGGIIFGPGPNDFDVLPGEVVHIKVSGRSFTIMTSQEAETLLAETHHVYSMPLPYDKQGQSTEKAK